MNQLPSSASGDENVRIKQTELNHRGFSQVQALSPDHLLPGQYLIKQIPEDPNIFSDKSIYAIYWREAE